MSRETPRPATDVAPLELRFAASQSSGEVSALLLRPPAARWLYLMAHGAGAGMRHPFLEAMGRRLAERDIATFRYQFPYVERRASRPDPQPILLSTVRAALAAAREAASDLPLIAGGKSMGGRMTSLAAAAEPLAGVLGLVFLGFPLHAAGRPGSERAEHLERVAAPMLFLQGTRDALADLERMRTLVEGLGDRATLHVVEDGDHSFRVRARSGRDDGAVLDELAATIEAWTRRLA
jgi:uncharacterized protein